MKIRLDRTMCDGFGACAVHAEQYFSLDDWGYAALIGDGTVAAGDERAVTRALLGCPVHAITSTNDNATDPPPPAAMNPPKDAEHATTAENRDDVTNNDSGLTHENAQ